MKKKSNLERTVLRAVEELPKLQRVRVYREVWEETTRPVYRRTADGVYRQDDPQAEYLVRDRLR